MNWWEALDPDVQKYAAGGVVTGSIALIGTIVTFVLSGIRDSRRETTRRDADRQAENDRRTADREAEDRRRENELKDRKDAHDHDREDELRVASAAAMRDSLSIAVGMLAIWENSGGRDVWMSSPTVRGRLRDLRAAALTIGDPDVREGLRQGVHALPSTSLRWQMGVTSASSQLQEEQSIVAAMTELLAGALRGEGGVVTRQTKLLAGFAVATDEAQAEMWGDGPIDDDELARAPEPPETPEPV